MEKLKKYLIFLAIFVVVVAAIMTALRMTNQSQQVSVSPMGVSKEYDASGEMRAVPMKSMSTEYLNEEGASAPMTDGVEDVAVEKKEIKNGSLTMRVNNADRALEQMSAIASEHNGEIYSSNFYQDAQSVKNGTVEVRVPADRFDSAFAALKKVATAVVGESTYGQDVTLAYRDVQARLKNKQAEEQSFLNLLNQSGKLSDVIDVTREVSRVRGEIEQLQAQIIYMQSQTDYATITVSMTEDENVTFSDQWRPMQVAKETVNALFKDMQGFVNFVIVLVVRVVPIMFLYGLIAFVFYAITKKVVGSLRQKKDDSLKNNQ